MTQLQHKQWFTDEQYKYLILKACEPGATEAQINLFLRDCERMKAEALTLEMLFGDHVKVAGYTKEDYLLTRVIVPGCKCAACQAGAAEPQRN